MFNVGDIVKCVKQPSGNYEYKFKVGTLYLVEEFDGKGNEMFWNTITLDGGHLMFVNSYIFKDYLVLHKASQQLNLNYHVKQHGEIHSPSCNHQWKLYTGFTNVYNYCVLCDEKKGIE